MRWRSHQAISPRRASPAAIVPGSGTAIIVVTPDPKLDVKALLKLKRLVLESEPVRFRIPPVTARVVVLEPSWILPSKVPPPLIVRIALPAPLLVTLLPLSRWLLSRRRNSSYNWRSNGPDRDQRNQFHLVMG